MPTENNLNPNYIIERLRKNLQSKVTEKPSEVMKALGLDAASGLNPVLAYLDTEKKMIERLTAKDYQTRQIKDFVRNYRSLSTDFRNLTSVQKQMGFNDAVQIAQARSQFTNLLGNYKTGSASLTRQLREINQSFEDLQTFQKGFDRKVLQYDLLTRETKEELAQEYQEQIKKTTEGKKAYEES